MKRVFQDNRKFNPEQVNYATTENELLSIVETLKDLRNINKPIAFYSRMLHPYPTTEIELLSITLKELGNILLGQQIKVNTDHKNLTYESFNTERLMR